MRAWKTTERRLRKRLQVVMQRWSQPQTPPKLSFSGDGQVQSSLLSKLMRLSLLLRLLQHACNGSITATAAVYACVAPAGALPAGSLGLDEEKRAASDFSRKLGKNKTSLCTATALE